MARIFLVGCSGHAAVVLDIIEKQGIHSVVGIIDSFAEPGTDALGLKVLGNEDALPRLMGNDVTGAIVAIGDNFTRHEVVRRIRAAAPALEFIVAVHPSAQLGSNVHLGPGTVVMANAVVNPNCSVGEHCIVNTTASIDHDTVLDDFSSLAPGAVTGGMVKVGRFSAVSLAAGVIHGRTIGSNVVIGAGAIVLDDIPDNVVAWGVPARVVRSRRIGEPYL